MEARARRSMLRRFVNHREVATHRQCGEVDSIEYSLVNLRRLTIFPRGETGGERPHKMKLRITRLLRRWVGKGLGVLNVAILASR